MQIVYDVEARFDVVEIVEYYERVDGPQLADRFTSKLKETIDHIATRPASFVEVRSNIRRANLDGFPHHVLFQMVDNTTIKILTVKHDKRHPDLGLDR